MKFMPAAIGLVLAVLVTACGSASGTQVTRAEQEDAIREAVFRYQFDHNDSGQQGLAHVYCLSLSEGQQDPSPDLMKRFAGNTPPVKPASACLVSHDAGVQDKATGATGLLFRVTALHWRSDTEVDVDGGYYEGSLSGSGDSYHVQRRGTGWVVTRGTQQWISWTAAKGSA